MPDRRAVELSIVVPLRDEEANIDALHTELSAVLHGLGRPYEIILIDDGSADRTFTRAAGIQASDPAVRVIRFTRNFGQTAAFAAGFAAARGGFIITCDGDLQNDPADIPRMLDLARTHDIVAGWRRHRKDAFLTKHVPSVAANTLIGWVSGVPLHDNGCSLKVFRAEVVKPLHLRPGMHRYLPALARQFGGRIVEVQVNHRPRQFGKSKYGLSRTFQVLADLVHLRRLMREAGQFRSGDSPLYEIAEVLESAPRT
ncbi:MAG: glycosyltransferase family 2 protein [Vicinamibacterales bacterium]